MKTVLITGIGGDIAQGVTSIVREVRAGYRIIGTDLHEEHGGRLFVDRFVRMPPAQDPGYIAALRALIEAEAADIVIPTTEAELAVLHPLFAPGKISWITAGASLVALGVDKLATCSHLAALGIAMPWTIPVAGGSPREFPCVVKERFGSGSRGVFVARDSDEAAYLAQRHPDAIFQEYLEPADREVTCAVYRAADGRVAVLQLLRKLAGGLTGWARVIRDPEVDSLCRTVADSCRLSGSANIQLRVTDRGPRIFEINPRFSSTVVMRDRLGFRDVRWSLAEIDGEHIEFPEIPVGRTVVRTHGAAIIPEEGIAQ